MNNPETIFRELVCQYSEQLYWHIRGFVDSHEDADDLLHRLLLIEREVDLLMDFRLHLIWTDGDGKNHDIDKMDDRYIKNCRNVINNAKLSVSTSNKAVKEDETKEPLNPWWMKYEADNYLKSLEAELEIRRRVFAGEYPKFYIEEKCKNCEKQYLCNRDLIEKCCDWQPMLMSINEYFDEYIDQEVALRAGFICNDKFFKR